MDAKRRALLRWAESPEERAIWQWLTDHAQPYALDGFAPPLRPPRRLDKPRRLVACLTDFERQAHDSMPVLRALQVAHGSMLATLPLCGDKDEADKAAELLFTDANRSALIVVPDGGKIGLHLMLRAFGRGWLRLGYTIQPLGAGNVIKGLVIRLDKRSWTVVDHVALTGLGALTEDAFLGAFAGTRHADQAPPTAWAAALRGFSSHLSEHFGTAAQVTIGRTALRAAMRHLPDHRWLWRTPPLPAAMMRAGGGFRGGYAVASRFSGDAWRADMNKAYTWALGEPLPHRMALSRPSGPLWTADGVYVCKVTGRGIVPAYLSVWKGPEAGFERTYHEGGDAWSILPLAELHGLARLGFSVRPVAGYAYSTTFNLAPWLVKLQGILDTHDREHPLSLLAKALGVNVYGKMAESPSRIDLMYALARPGADWHPYTDLDGEEHPDLWERRTEAHRPHQRIDIAATITARVRGRLYEGIADVHEAGGRVIHADTDGLLATIRPNLDARGDGNKIGAWRVDPEPLPSFVWGRKAYAYGDDVRVAGAWGVTAIDAALLAQGGTLGIEASMMAVPWKGTAIMEPLTRTLRATVA